MRLAVFEATLTAVLGVLAALLAVAARPVRARLRAQKEPAAPPSFAGWSAAALSEGPTSRRWLLGDDGVDDATRAGLATAWQETARAAHRALAASTRRALDLVTLSAPPELVASAHEHALDDLRRAKVCFALARGLDGRGPSPGAAVAPPRALPGPRVAALAGLATEVVVDVALARGVSACVSAKLARRTTDRFIRRALEEIAMAEERHARHAWDVIAWCLAEGGAPVEHALRARIGRLVPIARDVPQEAIDGGWERWGIAGAALERQEHARAADAIARKLAELAEKGRGGELVAA
ncbi:MAG: hypothetical protein KF795_33330 [Labilithrix sp.]|nr:hypothetical protein [Labilithrix sp.]